MCQKIHIPGPPPSPPQAPMMDLPLDYFPPVHFEAYDGGLYANGLPFNVKAVTWQGAEPDVVGVGLGLGWRPAQATGMEQESKAQ